MIIKQSRVKSGGSGNVIAHVLNEHDNEAVTVLRDDFDDLQVMEDIGQSVGRKYGIRHFIVSPDEALKSDQIDQVVSELSREFGFENRSVSIVAHAKTRADGGDAPHFHILVSELNRQNRVMDSSKMFARNEKVARKLEVMFGHDLQKGRHNKAVEQALRSEGHSDIADRMAPLTEGPPPNSAFSAKQHARAKRLGINLPRIAAEVQFISDLPIKEKAQKLKEIGDKYDVVFKQGDKRSVLTIQTKTGDLIGNANKAAGLKDFKEVAKIGRELRRSADAGDEGPANQTSRKAGQRTEADRRNQRTGGIDRSQRPVTDKPTGTKGPERGASGRRGRAGAAAEDVVSTGGSGRESEGTGRVQRGNEAVHASSNQAGLKGPSVKNQAASGLLRKAATAPSAGAALMDYDVTKPNVVVTDPDDPLAYKKAMDAFAAWWAEVLRKRSQAIDEAARSAGFPTPKHLRQHIKKARIAAFVDGNQQAQACFDHILAAADRWEREENYTFEVVEPEESYNSGMRM